MKSSREYRLLEGEAQHELIIREAQKRGIEIEDVSQEHGKLATVLRTRKKEELILQGIPATWMNEHAHKICDEKDQTKELFQKLGIPTPISYKFTRTSDLENLELFDGEKEYVCKPNIGTNGIGVVMGLKSMKELECYFQSHKQLADTFLLEEYFEGTDLRLQAIKGDLVAACIRIPAFVIGDDNKKLEELIRERRNVVKTQNPANNLLIDERSLQLIKDQGYSMTDLIPKGEKVKLKEVSNMAQGGHAIDVTDRLSLHFSKWIREISKALNTGYFALDLMAEDLNDISVKRVAAIEINSRAEWMHHTFSELRTHDLAKTILDFLFSAKK